MSCHFPSKPNLLEKLWRSLSDGTEMAKKGSPQLEHPFLEIVRNRFAGEIKDRQAHGVKRLKSLLEYLHETFIRDPALRQPEHRHWPIVWPRKEDLEEFDSLVFELAATLRKKPLSHDAAVEIVNNQWPSLKLGSFGQKMMRRLRVEFASKPPPPNEAVRHFERISKLSKEGDSKHSANAKKFMSDHNRLATHEIKPSQIEWNRHRELLYDEGMSSIRLENN